MPAAVGELLVVLRDWPLDCVAPVVVPRETGADGCGWRGELAEGKDVAGQFGCSD